ncbi:MAG TPA: SRPBCC domain-containing protein [Caulobacteraceae bacterium]|nr:SRPBCC domain-containing protein [Caulobacteraceae bacterium]
MKDADPDLTFEADLDHPPETVWRALTQPDLLAAWLPANDDAGPGEVIAEDPPHSISYAWRDGADAREQAVTFIVDARPGGSRLTIIHGLADAAGRPTMCWEGFKCAA